MALILMDLFFTLLPLFCVLGALGLLTLLTVIDLRVYLLPDKYVFPFGLLGIAFHASTGFRLLPPEGLVMGAVVGAGILLIVRYFGNMYYKQESMGLGDVKLLGAAGLWLGAGDVTVALTLGALAGLLHGIGIAAARRINTGTPFNMSRLVLPAGPGFIVGIVVVMAYAFGPALLMMMEQVLR